MDWPAPLTVREISAELRCSEDEVRALIRDGELKTVACGIRPGLVPRHEFDLYPEILARAGLLLEARLRRHVNRRTGRRAGEYFEDVLVARAA